MCSLPQNLWENILAHKKAEHAFVYVHSTNTNTNPTRMACESVSDTVYTVQTLYYRIKVKEEMGFCVVCIFAPKYTFHTPHTPHTPTPMRMCVSAVHIFKCLKKKVLGKSMCKYFINSQLHNKIRILCHRLQIQHVLERTEFRAGLRAILKKRRNPNVVQFAFRWNLGYQM